MLTRLQKAAQFAGDLNRGEFFVVLAAIYVLSYLIVRILSAGGVIAPASIQELMTRNMIASAALAIVCLPFFVGRLKNMRWPAVISSLLFVPLIPQALFVFHLSSGGAQASHSPAVYISATSYFELAVLMFVFVLLVWPSRTSVGVE